jgi:hypothetical protein
VVLQSAEQEILPHAEAHFVHPGHVLGSRPRRLWRWFPLGTRHAELRRRRSADDCRRLLPPSGASGRSGRSSDSALLLQGRVGGHDHPPRLHDLQGLPRRRPLREVHLRAGSDGHALSAPRHLASQGPDSSRKNPVPSLFIQQHTPRVRAGCVVFRLHGAIYSNSKP